MSIRQRIYLLLIAASLPLLAFVLYSATGGDDAHITWWSAYSFSHFGEFQEYSGERVEQSSSLLQVILLAGLHALTNAPLPLLGVSFSLLMGFATVLGVGSLARHWGADDKGVLLAAALAATCYPLTYWSTSGMDTSLAAFTFVLMLLHISKYVQGTGRWWQAGVAAALYLLTRPEGFFILSAILAFVGLVSMMKPDDSWKMARKRLTAIALMGLAFFAAVCLFRWLYFGRLFPEPVYVKAAGINWYKAKQGIKYLLRYAIHPVMIGWLLLTIAGIWMSMKTAGNNSASRKIATWVLGSCLATTGFIVLTGGDWMENARYLAPLLASLMAFVAITLSGASMWKRIARPTLLLAQVVTLMVTAALFSRGRPLWTAGKIHLPANANSEFSWIQYACKDGERDIPTAMQLEDIYEKVRMVKGDTVNVMSGQGGMIVYHLAMRHPHAFRWVDIWGLSDRSVADCPPTRAVQLIPIPTWSWEKYFELLPVIRHECPHFPEPDIICELDDVGFMPPLLEQHGYTVVYEQSGVLSSGDRFFPGLLLNAGQVLAVKSELAAAANLERPAHFAFPKSNQKPN